MHPALRNALLLVVLWSGIMFCLVEVDIDSCNVVKTGDNM